MSEPKLREAMDNLARVCGCGTQVSDLGIVRAAAATIAAGYRVKDDLHAQIERLTAELEESRAFEAAFKGSTIGELTKAKAKCERLHAALERCARWMNERVGNTWEAHDAVDPTLWDELKALRIPPLAGAAEPKP